MITTDKRMNDFENIILKKAIFQNFLLSG